ncbi:hypothetical protein V6Z12_D05G137300 [Gossypium hirsutum]
MAAGQELKDAESGYLVSAGGTFRLGFFSPGSSNNRYLGMWYNQPQPADRKAVWVANRDNPLFDKFGILIIDEVGSLKVSHGGGSPFVLSSPARTASNVSATLLDSGNFIIRELSSDGSTKRIFSWISDAVPANGSFTLGVDPSGASQWIISWKGYTENEEERYFFSTNKNHSMSRNSITSSGEILERSKAAPFRSCGLYRSNNLPTGCIQPTAHKCSTYFVQQYKHSKASFKGKFKFGEYSNLSLYDCNANCSSDYSCVAFAYDDRTASCDVWSRGMNSKSHPIFYKETTQLYFMLVDNSSVDETEVEMRNKEGKTNQELQFFSLETIAHATNNFAATNKLGEGGFGPVYKGKLHSELKNEALLIAKLQHTNLVRREGCCLEKEEKMLIYEYMPNKSLDFFLFDAEQKNVLDWKKRYNIIESVGQGLLYLHKYSRLKVIHRDLKGSNILLLDDMNPKISDFGMAKIFGHHDSKANTERIVGTYGYMSPEYAMDGIYSTRSDMFSFGVLLLEIITGRKHNSFHSLSGPLSLVAYAWEAWNEGRALELIDPSLGESYPKDEVMRCIHVGPLCGQDNPVDRPTILDALSMMYSEGNQLPTPKPPAYYFSRNRDEPEIVECELQIFSPNNLSITEMEAR